MSDLEKVVSVILQGQDELTGVLKSATAGLDNFGHSITSATQPLADMSAAVLKTEAALAAMAIGGLALAFNESIKFEGAVIELKKVIGDEVELLDIAAEQALEYSDKYGISATEVLASTANFKQAGFDVEGAMALTAASLDLVIAGDLEAAQANEILVATLKGFKAPAEDAARVTDILNEVSNEYAVSVDELGTGMAKLSPIANQMGFSFEETAGVLTPVIEVFRSGDEAANALKTGLLKLIDDTPAVQNALESIGVSQYDLNGEMRSGKDILYDVSAAFVDLDDNQKLVVTSQLVGINQAGRMVEVFDQLSKTTEVTAVAMDSAGSAALEVAARLESSEVAVERFKVGFQNLGIVIGDEFRVAATEAINGATEIELALQEVVKSDTFDPIFNALNDFATQLGVDLTLIAEQLPEAFENVDFTGLLEAIENLSGEFTDLFEAFFGEIDLTTAEGLEEALQKIIDAFAALTNVAAGIVDSFEPFIEMLSDMIDEFSDVDASTQEVIGQILGFGQAINLVFDNIGGLTGALETLVTLLSVKTVASLASTVLSTDSLTAAMKLAGPAVGGLAGAAAALVAGWQLGTMLAEEYPIINDWADAILEAADSVFEFTSRPLDTDDWMSPELLDDTQALVERIQAADEAAKGLQLTADEEMKLLVATNEDDLDAFLGKLEDIPPEQTVDLKPDFDSDAFIKVGDDIIQIIPGADEDEPLEILVTSTADQAAIDKTKDTIEKDLPAQRLMEIQLQGDIDKEIAEIVAQADTVQEAMKWSAEIDIAQIEADAQRAEAAFESVGAAVESSGDVLVSMFDKFGDLTALQQLALEGYIEQELQIQRDLVDAQIKLIESELLLQEEQLKKMKAGESLITIDGTNLEPELEAMMMKILENIQIHANTEGADFLLGI